MAKRKKPTPFEEMVKRNRKEASKKLLRRECVTLTFKSVGVDGRKRRNVSPAFIKKKMEYDTPAPPTGDQGAGQGGEGDG